mmetsp:Transcript_30592/g.77214  ORF Transcript_30592/g.77214 Transcript_30592/m.77214 type:complete len:247 (-) Transcript_30592:2656-3396(-)
MTSGTKWPTCGTPCCGALRATSSSRRHATTPRKALWPGTSAGTCLETSSSSSLSSSEPCICSIHTNSGSPSGWKLPTKASCSVRSSYSRTSASSSEKLGRSGVPMLRKNRCTAIHCSLSRSARQPSQAPPAAPASSCSLNISRAVAMSPPAATHSLACHCRAVAPSPSGAMPSRNSRKVCPSAFSAAHLLRKTSRTRPAMAWSPSACFACAATMGQSLNQGSPASPASTQSRGSGSSTSGGTAGSP